MPIKTPKNEKIKIKNQIFKKVPSKKHESDNPK